MIPKFEAKTEAVGLLYQRDNSGENVPILATIRDPKSRHFVSYKLVEVNGDDLEKIFKQVAGGDTIESKCDLVIEDEEKK